MLELQRDIVGIWTFRDVPDVGDGTDPIKNISMMLWFMRRFLQDEASFAQMLSVSERTVYRWKKSGLPRKELITLMALAGLIRLDVPSWRR